VNARSLAADLLRRWSHSRQLADDLLENSLRQSDLNASDRGLTQELFYGCLRHRLALDFLLKQLASRSPRAQVAIPLHIGLYQLFFLDKIPAHAAVHETVELVKQSATPAEANFANAILRQALRQREALVIKLNHAPPWVRFSHPRWLWERWQKHWGTDAAAALCEWNNAPPPVYVRLNTLRASVVPAPGLKQDKIAAFPAICFQVENAEGFFSSDAWKRGAFYTQDPSTLMAVDVLDPQPGESVLDMCAAPGGKTTYIAQKMQNRGKIVAADSSNPRLSLVIENCRRLGVTIVATIACDAGRCLKGRQFDRVLVDAPCSNTGVLRRRADLRWRIEEKEIARLAETQLRLLQSAAELTRPGGVLVYSTCSIESDENEAVAGRFEAAHPGFTREQMRATFPPRDAMDGAFVVRWRKNESGAGR
jgi:16S rRNA (cytosine967-C5)-methyltransferase